MSSLDFSRQSLIVDQGKIGALKVLVIGAGGIGSNLVHMMASMGVSNISVLDFDAVHEENVAPGWFSIQNLGNAKVDAIRLTAFEWYGLEVDAIFGRIEDYIPDKEWDIVMVSTDSLQSRKLAYQKLAGSTRWWVDARMGATGIEVFAFQPNSDLDEQYRPSLEFVAEPLPCGQKATAPLTKGIIPGLVGQVVFDIVTEGNVPPFYQTYDMRQVKEYRLVIT
jgi:hypothetical protein